MSDVNDGYVGMFWRQLYPDPVASVGLAEIGNAVQITWDIVPSGVSSLYEVWSSVGDENNYQLISIISNVEIASGEESVTIVDRTYGASGMIYYKIYHVATGHYSTVLSSGIQLTYAVSDPSELQIAASLNTLTLDWVNPDDRLLDGTMVMHDSNSGIENLLESNSALVFSGLASTYTYEVPFDETYYWHQFWVSSITRTA